MKIFISHILAPETIIVYVCEVSKHAFIILFKTLYAALEFIVLRYSRGTRHIWSGLLDAHGEPLIAEAMERKI